jgi:hypothetical protein
MTTALDELEQSGFVNVYYPFGKKVRDKVWRLTDEYSLFYLQFIEDKLMQLEHNWMNLMDSQSYSRQSVFVQTTQTKKFVSWVLVTTFGLKNPGGTDHVLTLDDLFL